MQYEANFLASVHTEEHINRYVKGLEDFRQPGEIIMGLLLDAQ